LNRVVVASFGDEPSIEMIDILAQRGDVIAVALDVWHAPELA
jgi:hypothetical protein